MPNILIIDDDKSVRRTLSEILGFEGYQTEEAVDGKEGIKKFSEKPYDVVLCDNEMPQLSGFDFLDKAKKIHADVPIVIMNGAGNVNHAVEAVKRGAFDYINKPPDLNRLFITLRNAVEKQHLLQEAKVLKSKLPKVQPMIGESRQLQLIKETIDKVAPTEARVLITGESGSGKELVAQWIHEKSHRQQGPFVEVNCAAIPGELIESELFGHEKGSFTSAIKQRIGKFEQAMGGTLFLDEIGDMSLDAQSKMLRALQENKITRVGGEKDIPVNVRVIAATNKNLLEEIEHKRFRIDLYHRIGVIMIHVSSLNERRTDIPHLIHYFLQQLAAEYGQPAKNISADAIHALQSHQWTGNIRELRNVVERLIILSNKSIGLADVNRYVLPHGSD
jgi:hypothetical protein